MERLEVRLCKAERGDTVTKWGQCRLQGTLHCSFVELHRVFDLRVMYFFLQIQKVFFLKLLHFLYPYFILFLYFSSHLKNVRLHVPYHPSHRVQR